MSLKGRDFLKLLDFTKEEIAALLSLAAELKAKKKAGVAHRICEGKNIALIFEKTSTRTRCAFEVAARDFENRQAVNFAVRLDGKLIGEAVLYRCDYRGGAELGCRIDKAWAGKGYGTEAFAAVEVSPTARLFGIITPCAPEHSAERMIAPRLCGSSTPSSKITNGASPRSSA